MVFCKHGDEISSSIKPGNELSMKCRENLAYHGVSQSYKAQDKHKAFYSSCELLVDFAESRGGHCVPLLTPSGCAHRQPHNCPSGRVTCSPYKVMLLDTVTSHQNGLWKYENLTNFSTQSRSAGPEKNLEDRIMCCLQTSWEGDRWIWTNNWMLVSRGKSTKLEVKPASASLRPIRVQSHTKSPGAEPEAPRREASA